MFLVNSIYLNKYFSNIEWMEWTKSNEERRRGWFQDFKPHDRNGFKVFFLSSKTFLNYSQCDDLSNKNELRKPQCCTNEEKWGAEESTLTTTPSRDR